MFYFIPFIFTFLFILSLVSFYLDDFRLSKIHLIKCLQIFYFICVLLYIGYCICNVSYIFISDIIIYAKDNNDINLHGHINLDKDAGKAIGQGISTVGSQIGLGATMVGVSTAVGKTVAKSGMPPLQKVGFIIGSGLVAGLGHSVISTINRRNIYEDNANVTTYVTSSNVDSHINKLIDDSHISPLQELLLNGEMLSYVCLGILYLLIIQLVFKLYFKDNINLKLSELLGNNINNKVEFYLNKIIKLNKQMSVVWIWFGLVTIVFGLSFSAYAIYDILINLDSYVNIHSRLNPNIINNIYSIDIYKQSIKDILLNLKVINYISFIIMIILMLQIMLKFHYNKNINNIYIWLVLLGLILALALAAYIYGDLYTHINDYVSIYINLIK